MITEPFAPMTPTASKLLSAANPTTYRLWILLRQQHRPGTRFRFSAQEVAGELNRSENWVRKSLQALINMGMVERLNQWFRGIYELRILFQEGQFTDAQSNSYKSDRTREETSVKPESTPDSFVPYSQRSKEKHELFKKDQGISKSTDLQEQSSRCLESRELVWREVTAIAPEFNRKSFVKLFSTFGENRIRNAIEAIRQQKDRGNLRSVASALYTAIQRGFTLNKNSQGIQKSTDCDDSGPRDTKSAPVTANYLTAFSQERESKPIDKEMGQLKSLQGKEKVVDLSSQLAEISVLTLLLNWNKETVKNKLKERYGTELPLHLTVSQVYDWLNYLQLESRQGCDALIL